MDLSGGKHLGYCTNIHPAETLEEVCASLNRYTREVKKRIAPGSRFGLGLRLSNSAAASLMVNDKLEKFRQYLGELDMYVFTLNGFPYGSFHGERIKEKVHDPDWRYPERLNYTRNLIQILAGLLPEDLKDAGISTNPLGYRDKINVAQKKNLEKIVQHLIDAVYLMHHINERQGKTIHLDIEPEPDGYIELSTEVADFFNDHLLMSGAGLLADRLKVSKSRSEELIRRHIRVCLDACHMAVEYETTGDFLGNLGKAGILVGKIQLSSALRTRFSVSREEFLQALPEMKRQLGEFAESTYLHQVKQRNVDGSYSQYPDLTDALESLHDQAGIAAEWRIHFHVPVFLEKYESFESTQPVIPEILNRLPGCKYLEVETYTWGVLPAPLQTDVVDMITRELNWVREITGDQAEQNRLE